MDYTKAHELAQYEILRYQMNHGPLPETVKTMLHRYRVAEYDVYEVGTGSPQLMKLLATRSVDLYSACGAAGVSVGALILGQ